MVTLRRAKAEKARFRILFADYKQLMSPELQRTTAVNPTPFMGLGGTAFSDTFNISYNPSKHQYL